MTAQEEQWKPAGHGSCEASSLGRIRRHGQVLNQWRHNKGYLCVTAGAVHRLVLMAFRGQPENGSRTHSRHLNGDCTDNRLENLAWGTPKDNADDMRRHGTHRNTAKTHCIRGHEFTEENTYRRGANKRTCLACKRIMENRAYYRRKGSEVLTCRHGM